MSFPGRQVVAFCGDGGLTMLLGDLLTIVAEKLPIKIVLFNNSSLGMVRSEMMVGGYPFFGTEVHNPNLAAVATAMGLHGERVERAVDILPALERAFAYPGPALIDFTTDPDALAIPPKTTFAEVRGFALAMTRMVFDHRGEQVLDWPKITSATCLALGDRPSVLWRPQRAASACSQITCVGGETVGSRTIDRLRQTL